MPQYKYETKKGIFWMFKCQYEDWKGNKLTKLQRGFKTMREAKQAEQEFLNSKKTDGNITFKELMKYYIPQHKEDCKPLTHKITEIYIDSIFLPYFGEAQLSKINTQAIEDWKLQIKAETITLKDGTIKPKYTPSTIKNILGRLSAIFNFAISRNFMTENPVACKSGINAPSKNNNISFWTVDEFNQFLNEVDTIKCNTKKFVVPRNIYKLTYSVLFYSGIRIGEYLALTIGDYNSKEGYLNINKTISVLDKDNILIQNPKTKAGFRTVSLPRKICEKLDEYIKTLPSNSPEDLLFPLLSLDQIRWMIDKVTSHTNIKRIRIHDLRHSHASMLINMGVNIKAISYRLGHEDIQTTLKIYSHLYPKFGKELADKINVNVLL